MTIRPRLPEDLPSCVAVLANVHHADGYPEIWQVDAAGWLDPPGTIVAWVAESAGGILGHVSLTAAASDPACPANSAAGIVKLSRLFVDPAAQGGGVARRLMATAVSWAQGRGLDVILEVYEGTPAVALYERLGWRFLNRAPASWLGAHGRRPTLRYYAAPGNPVALQWRPGKNQPMTMHSMSAEVSGYQIAASRWPGDGNSDARTIVLLHAGVCDRRSWYWTADHLTDLGTIIAYDRRGFGDSPVSPGPYRDIDDLWSVVERVTDGPVWLVGSSMGGELALDAAVISPARVAGLVLFAPAISGAPEPEDLDAETMALADQLAAAAQTGDQKQRLQLRIRLWLDGPAATQARVGGPARELALAMNEVLLDNDADDEAGSAGIDVWSRLERIQTPATVVWGDLDVPSEIEQSQRLAGRLPQARRRVLPGTAHLPYLEQPELVADVIREAIRQAP